jgi:hypothetical protein
MYAGGRPFHPGRISRIGRYTASGDILRSGDRTTRVRPSGIGADNKHSMEAPLRRDRAQPPQYESPKAVKEEFPYSHASTLNSNGDSSNENSIGRVLGQA